MAALQEAPTLVVRPPVWKGFVAGSIAAVIAGCVTHPIDLIKVRMQIANSAPGRYGDFLPNSGNAATAPRASLGILTTTASVVRNEGFLGLYAGISGSILRQTVLVGARLGVYDALKNVLVDKDGRLDFATSLACGAAAGAIAASVRMQADGSLPVAERRNYRHAGDALVRIVRTEGIGSLWRGVSSTMSRAVIVTAAQMSFYDQAKHFFIENAGMGDTPLTHGSASLVAGGMAALSSNPFDVAKTRLQNMRPGENGQLPYRGMFNCMWVTASKEGFTALYKGLLATWARQAPLNTVRFMALEQLKKVL